MNYTSPNLDSFSLSETSERLLMHLKRVGTASTAELAAWLGVSSEAARLQVQKLLSHELLEGATEPRLGPGRPRQLWRLSTFAHARFPDTHAQLAAELLGSIHALYGADGVEHLIAQREAEIARAYSAALHDAPTFLCRLERLVALRVAEGYMARLEPDGEAGWLLIEDHCPICAAATVCRGFCSSELRLFQQLLAPASVIRAEHLLGGGRRCLYKITLSC